MKYFDVPHGSDEWFECRRGIPTASCFDKIITPKGVFSKQSTSYAHLLIAEIITGESQDKFPPTYAMERGSIMEAEAAEAYEFMSGNKLLAGCFISDDEVRWGASPDRLIVDADGNIVGCLEIKCPLAPTHVENLLSGEIDDKYIPQVQGQMMMDSRFKFAHWFSYHPQMPQSIIEVQRDDAFIAKMTQGLEQFHAYKIQALEKLVKLGAIDAVPNKLDELNKVLSARETDFVNYLMAG